MLIKNDLLDAVTAIRLSKAVIRNIRQNLFWAFFYNCIGIPLAAGVFYNALGWQLNPMFGAAAMSLSSICVVSNALRLKFFRPEHLRYQKTPAAETADQGQAPEVSAAAVPSGPETVKEREEYQMAKHEAELKVEGMMCAHCKAHVEKALGGLPGAEAQVDLDAGTATVRSEEEISDEVFKKTIEDAGYELKGIERK